MIDQLFFQPSSGFTGGSFTYTATDDKGTADATPATVTLVSSTNPNRPDLSNNCKPGKQLKGNKRRNRLEGTPDSDTIFGLEGNDTLRGLGCNDLLDGGRDNDRIFGGSGNDTLAGRQGNDTLEGGQGKDTLDGAKGTDKINGGSGNDFLKGGIKNDILQGEMGNDFLSGGVGRDQLVGSKGQDILLGNHGPDTLTGGEGKDRFVYLLDTDGVDRITDFNIRQDIVDLNQILNKPNYKSLDPINSYLKFIQVGSNTKIEVDFNGDIPGGFKSLLILENIMASHLNIENFIV